MLKIGTRVKVMGDAELVGTVIGYCQYSTEVSPWRPAPEATDSEGYVIGLEQSDCTFIAKDRIYVSAILVNVSSVTELE